jgi:hypothetical protein
MTRPRGRFAKKNLLGTSITVHGKRTMALLNSGCEAKLVVSRRFADLNGIRYCPIGREVGLPDGSRMAAARSDPIDLTVADVTRQEAAVVVDLAAFDCILGYRGSRTTTQSSAGRRRSYWYPHLTGR